MPGHPGDHVCRRAGCPGGFDPARLTPRGTDPACTPHNGQFAPENRGSKAATRQGDMTDTTPTLHICVTCRANLPLVENEKVMGRKLYEAVADHLDPMISLQPVVCLGNCLQGCSAAMTQQGKWSYLLGHLTPDHAADLAHYALAFVKSENGTVWRSGRADSLRDAIVARIPGQGFTQKETA